MAFKWSTDAGVTWAEKTAPEINNIVEDDGSIVIVPVGSIEQHGNHLPVATDTILVNSMAHLGAERVAQDIPLVVTPPIWSGFSPHHMPFGGTITLEFETLLHIVEDVSKSAINNGFDAVLLLNGHGGNMSLISSAVKTIGDSNPEIEIIGLTYFNLAPYFIDSIRDSDPGGMSHGGEFETSLMLHVQPDLVDQDQIEGTPRERVYNREGVDLMGGGPISVYRTFDEYSDSGAIGEPDLATAEKGKRIYENLGDELEVLLNEIHQKNS